MLYEGSLEEESAMLIVSLMSGEIGYLDTCLWGRSQVISRFMYDEDVEKRSS